MKVKAITPIKQGGKKCKAGATVEIEDEEEARALIAAGAAEAVKSGAQKPAEQTP